MSQNATGTEKREKEPIVINNTNSVIGWIDSFLKLLKQYGVSKIIIATLLVTIISIFMYFAFNPSKIFQVYETWKEDQHIELIETRKRNAPKIQSLIDKLTLYVNANRTVILELHNGNSGVGGLPFNKCSATFEGLNIGTPPVGSQYQEQTLTLIPFASFLFNHGYWSGPTDSIKTIDKALYHKLKSNNAEYICAGVIEGIDYPLAFIFVTYEKIPDENYDMSLVRENIQHVAMEVAVLLEVERRTSKK